MARRIVLGIVEAKCPRHAAGHQCATLGWIDGFRELGWDVWIVEQMSGGGWSDAHGQPCAAEASINAQAWREFVRLHGFEGRETLVIDGEAPSLRALRDFADSADLFLNYSGQFHALELLGDRVPKAYLDVDPAYTQVWAAAYGCDMNFDGHDHFVNVGGPLSAAGDRVPNCGRRWIETLPPALTKRFGPLPPEGGRPWTTVAHWYAGDEVRHGELVLRPKRDMFRDFLTLPSRAQASLVVACDLQPGWEGYADYEGAGWGFRDVKDVCASIENYRAFIGQSAGEIGIPKGGYVAARTGWMSDRSMVYLANGRPVVAMDTGWKALVGESEGLRAFDTVEEAATCLEEVGRNHEAACRAARHVAETHFAGPLVITRLLERLGIA